MREQFGEKVQSMGDLTKGPTLVRSIPFNSFTASTTLWGSLSGLLTRNAKKRTFILVNKMDQSFSSSPSFYPYDSSISGITGYISSASISTPGNYGSISIETSEKTPLLGSNVDSFEYGFSVGATAPTSGNLEIYIVEVM